MTSFVPPPALPLTEAMVADDSALSWVVDEIILNDPQARAAQRTVVEAQGRLRGQVTDAAWAGVLTMEAAMTTRSSDLPLTIARWAFREGYLRGREESP